LRVASLHLRMGQHALARAELEAFAGRGLLDEQALLDLAEVRWRSGDLVGATEAASALLSRGHETLLALVIAAEGFAVSGRPTEARRLALQAVEMAGTSLGSVFAGMPSSRIWPDGQLPVSPATGTSDEPAEPEGAAELAGLAAPLTQGAETELAVEAASEPVSHAEPEPEPEQLRDTQPVDALDTDVDEQAALESEAKAAAAVQAPTPSANAIAAAAVAMHSGRIDQASLLFGLALRLDPSSAAYVLEQLGVPAADPRLALVEGDALRLLGRDVEARDAFRRAGGSLFDGGHKD
jgi:tetratricopeptide (TPR) repeat protein